MQLVWANCMAFNEDGSDMFNAGVAAGAMPYQFVCGPF